jgi:predicted AlkP superfamily pyrophosphatase or phosphodiesterase
MVKINRLLVLTVLFIQTLHVHAQKKLQIPPAKAKGELQASKPRLVIGIVVDQMRYDYLHRFDEEYQDGGFRRLLREGFSYANANYDYVPTYTGPGHACIFSGTGPAVNGIISNDWYDRALGKTINCVGDTTVSAVGTTSISGKMSPRKLLSTTVCDELRVSTNFQSKVIGIALKDRGAILPAGHTANGAFWHDAYTGNWVTSTYYMDQLPPWVSEFNTRKIADSLLSQPWNLLLSTEAYDESTADDTPYEGLFKGESKPVFPHDLPAIRTLDKELIRRTPAGNTFTLRFAKAAIEGEQLGQRGITDFLTVSFSSTDYIGHQFGTNAMELQDMYLRFDLELAEFIDYLDQKIGRGNYLLFLTSDHGAASNPTYNHDHDLPGEFFESGEAFARLDEFLTKEYGPGDYVSHTNARQVYLNRDLIAEKKINAGEMREKCVQLLKQFPGIAEAVTCDELQEEVKRDGIFSFLQKGYHDQRSADITMELFPGWIDWYGKTGTTHGSAYSYDTHVPLIFFGGVIRAGISYSSVSISDVAPTISAILEIENPSGTTGKQLKEVLD